MSMLKGTTLLLAGALAALPLGCGGSGDDATGTGPVTASLRGAGPPAESDFGPCASSPIDAEEYAALSGAIAGLYGGDAGTTFVINRRTAVAAETEALWGFMTAELQASLPPMTATVEPPETMGEMLADYEAKNATSACVGYGFQFEQPYAIFGADQFEALFPPDPARLPRINGGARIEDTTGPVLRVAGVDAGWAAFRARYPDAAGFTTVTRPGFNAAHSMAAVFLTNASAPLAGTGQWVVLVSDGPRWYVARTYLIWTA